MILKNEILDSILTFLRRKYLWIGYRILYSFNTGARIRTLDLPALSNEDTACSRTQCMAAAPNQPRTLFKCRHFLWKPINSFLHSSFLYTLFSDVCYRHFATTESCDSMTVNITKIFITIMRDMIIQLFLEMFGKKNQHNLSKWKT